MKNRNQILRQEILDHKLEENVAVITGATAVYAASLPPLRLLSEDRLEDTGR
jgi:hypothetical protein